MRPLPVRHIKRARHLRRFFIAPLQMPRSLDVSHWKRTHFVWFSLSFKGAPCDLIMDDKFFQEPVPPMILCRHAEISDCLNVKSQGNQHSPFCLLYLIFWMLRSFFGTAAVESYLRGETSPLRFTTTAVPQKLHSAQKINCNKQIGEYWFTCGQIVPKLKTSIHTIVVELVH